MSEQSSGLFPLSPLQRRIWELDPESLVTLDLRVAESLDGEEVAARLRAAAEGKDALRARLVELPEFRLPRQATDAGCCVSAALGGGGTRMTLSAAAIFVDVFSLWLLAREILEGPQGDPVPPLEQIAVWQESLTEEEPEGERAATAWRSAEASMQWRLPFASAANDDSGAQSVLPLKLSDRAGLGVDALVEAGTSIDVLAAAASQSMARILNWNRGCATAHVLSGRPFEDLMPAIAPLSAAVPLQLDFDAAESFLHCAGLAAAALDEAGGHEVYMHLAPPSRERLGSQSVVGTPSAVPLSVRSPMTDALLRLTLLGADGAWSAQLEFDGSRFTSGAAAAMGRLVETCLESFFVDPEAPVAEACRERGTGSPVASVAEAPRPPARFLERVAEEASRSPGRPALRGADGEVDFGELERWSGALAARLASMGQGPVAVVGRRRPATVIAILAALRAGRPYVPLDPSAPADYVRRQLETAECNCVLDSEEGDPLHGLPHVDINESRDGEADFPTPVPDPADLAYVLFTSGSTGHPKGVKIPHRGLDTLASGILEAVHRHHPQLRSVAVNAPFTFDASLKQLCALSWGATLQLVPEECRLDPQEFTAYLAQNEVGCVDCTPTQLRSIAQAGLFDSLPPVVLVGGERIDDELWAAAASCHSSVFYNVYGLTEATDVSAVARIEDPHSTPNFGHPLPGVRLRVVDREGRDYPSGIPGELQIGGYGVASGYVPSVGTGPFYEQDSLLFVRSGDLVRLLEDGTYEFLGRTDAQIKLRGVRVEPAEVEQALREHPGVADVVVDLVSLHDGRPSLFALVVPTTPGSLELRGRRTMDLGDGLVVAHLNQHETDYLRTEIFEGPGYLRDGLHLRCGDTVIDVGANIGLAALSFHRAAPGIRVFGFEPVPELAEIAQVNLRAHGVEGSVEAYGLGATHEVAELTFYPSYSIMSSRHADPAAEEQTVRQYIANRVDEGEGDVALLEHLDVYLQDRFVPERLDCRFRRLSTVMGELELEEVALLKIDVQRSELEVLEGIDPEDFGRIRQVSMEVHDFGENIQTVRGLLEVNGFAPNVRQDDDLAGTDRWHLTATRAGCKPAEDPAPRSSDREELVSAGMLRHHLASRLPEALRPSLIVLADRVPLTANGKFDLAAAASLAREQQAPISESEPRTPAEALLVAIFRSYFGAELVGLDDNFYEMGGDSILQVQIAAEAAAKGLLLLPKDFVSEPTVRALAATAAVRDPAARRQTEIAAGSSRMELDAVERERLEQDREAGIDPW